MIARLLTGRVWTVFLVGVASVYGAAMAIVIFTAGPIYSVPLVLATAFPLLVYASQNPRLFFLFGLAFTAPIQTSLNLFSQPHMGGAFALSIHLADFFLLPLVVFLLRDFYRGDRFKLRVSPVTGWWLAMVALGILAVILGPFRKMSLFEVVQMLKLWILFMVIINECVRERHFHIVLMGLGANVAVNVLVALVQYALKRTLGLGALGEIPDDAAMGANFSVYAEFSDVFRVTGLAGHANLFGPYLALMLPILIGIQFTSHRFGVRALAAVLAVGGVACLILTLSRSAWASFALSAGVLMLALFGLREMRRRYLGLKFAMLGVAVVILATASGPILLRLVGSDPGAFDFRIEMVKIAWKMVQDNPFLGVGLNTFDFHLPEYGPWSFARIFENFGEIFPVVHNTYMIIWSEQGTVGLLLFLAMHVSVFRIAVKNLDYHMLNDKIYMLSLSAACGVLGIMLDGFSSFFVKVHQFGRVFWIILGLIVAAHYWNLANARLRRPAPAPGPDAGHGSGREPVPGQAPAQV